MPVQSRQLSLGWTIALTLLIVLTTIAVAVGSIAASHAIGVQSRATSNTERIACIEGQMSQIMQALGRIETKIDKP